MKKSDALKRTEAALRNVKSAGEGGSFEEALASAPRATDQAVAIVEVYGREGAREVADWHAAFAAAGRAALVSPNLTPHEEQDDAAQLFADFSLASARGLTTPRGTLASMRRCGPAETALGIIRLFASRFGGVDQARDTFAQSEVIAEHVRAVLGKGRD
jgi:hypothetical protein